MRPSRKARGGRIPGVFDRRATQRDGMQRRPNATVIMKVSTKQPLLQPDRYAVDSRRASGRRGPYVADVAHAGGRCPALGT